jgi:hypothetical protein
LWSVISWWSVLLLEETGVPRENQRPVASHWHTLSHKSVSSTPRHLLYIMLFKDKIKIIIISIHHISYITGIHYRSHFLYHSLVYIIDHISYITGIDYRSDFLYHWYTL